MLEIEGETMGSILPFTSTQMGGVHPRRPSLFMSPIMDKEYQNPSCSRVHSDSEVNLLLGNNRFALLDDEVKLCNDLNKYNGKDSPRCDKVDTSNQSLEIVPTGGTLHDPVPPAEAEVGDAQPAAGSVGADDGENAGHSKGGVREGVADGSGDDECDTGEGQTKKPDPNHVTARLAEVDKMLGELGNKSTILTNLVCGLRESLEFSQKEIEELKGENRELR